MSQYVDNLSQFGQNLTGLACSSPCSSLHYLLSRTMSLSPSSCSNTVSLVLPYVSVDQSSAPSTGVEKGPNSFCPRNSHIFLVSIVLLPSQTSEGISPFHITSVTIAYITTATNHIQLHSAMVSIINIKQDFSTHNYISI